MRSESTVAQGGALWAGLRTSQLEHSKFTSTSPASLRQSPPGLQLPFRFDPALLREALAQVSPNDWSPHYNRADYGGVWRGAALRSPAGASNNLNAGPAGSTAFEDTPLLQRSPYFRRALAVFECPLKSVRLLSLAPGSFIREHTDNALDYEDGEIRIHIPIQTNPGVEFYVCGERLQLDAGGCYYLNVNLPHRVNNRGAGDRIHLVIDAQVNDWVHALFRRGAAEAWHIPRCPLPPRSFEEFRTQALETPTLSEKLRPIASHSEFVATAIEMGRSLGYDFNESDIGAGLRHPAILHNALGQALPPANLPIKVYLRESRPVAEWIDIGARHFTEPFFEDTVRAAMLEPFTALSRREMPLEAAACLTPVSPSGFIYHMSRCGSTLVAQMLKTLPGAVVLSEPVPLDDAIQLRLQLPELAPPDHIEWLRWVVTALGPRPAGQPTPYFIKLDAWHIHDLPLLRAAFPDSPWIFLHRNPAEVLASQRRSPGMLAAPGAMDPRILRLASEDITRLSREQWPQRVIAGFLAAAEAFRNDAKGLFVDYSNLPEAMCKRVAAHFGLSLDSQAVARMQEAASFDAKNPSLPFVGSAGPWPAHR